MSSAARQHAVGQLEVGRVPLVDVEAEALGVGERARQPGPVPDEPERFAASGRPG